MGFIRALSGVFGVSRRRGYIDRNTLPQGIAMRPSLLTALTAGTASAAEDVAEIAARAEKAIRAIKGVSEGQPDLGPAPEHPMVE